MISSARTALGDLQDPKYQAWSKFVNFENTHKHKIEGFSSQSLLMINLIYLAWGACIFFNMLILLNFLIASIGESYSRYVQNKEAVLYFQRQEMVQEIKEVDRFLSS